MARARLPAINKLKFVPFKNLPEKFGRKVVTKKAMEGYVRTLKKQLGTKAAKLIGKKIAQKAATAWLTFIPIVNVVSTAYDVYDIATTGYDIYESIDKAVKAYKGDVYRTYPDVAISNADGKLADIYDFKVGNDSLSNNPGQKELYERALSDAGKKPPDVKIIDVDKCQCDIGRSSLKPPLKAGV